MQKISDWFKEKRNKEIKIENIHFLAYREEKTIHWSPDCWILEYCVDKKKLKFCYEYEDFPCDKLTKWPKGDEDYTEALDCLKKMKK